MTMVSHIQCSTTGWSKHELISFVGSHMFSIIQTGTKANSNFFDRWQHGLHRLGVYKRFWRMLGNICPTLSCAPPPSRLSFNHNPSCPVPKTTDGRTGGKVVHNTLPRCHSLPEGRHEEDSSSAAWRCHFVWLLRVSICTTN